MSDRSPPVHPVHGKTYSLFGKHETTSYYYEQIRAMADELLGLYPGIQTLLAHIRQLSDYRRGKLYRLKIGDFPMNDQDMLDLLEHVFGEFLEDIKSHRRSLPVHKWFDRTLRTTRHQYLLYMVEIEITNRLHLVSFQGRDIKIAFLPHCLRADIPGCKATSDGVDYVCRRCTRSCFIRHISDLMKQHNIRPYIWMRINLRRYMRELVKADKTAGVFGMACIPELVHGMRRCDRIGLPVIGLPLNANRCQRWMGEFYENSVDLKELTNLLT